MSQVLLGQSGWDDTDEVFFPGSFEDDGHTLVRCQLYSGRDITKDHTPDRAQGTKLVCKVSDNVKIPPKGTTVYILVPHGMEGVEGAGVIVATVSVGAELRRNLSEGDMAFQPSEGQAGIIAKKDGSITLHTTDSNTPEGNSIFLRITKNALQFASPWGRLVFDKSGFHCVTKSGARMDMGGINIPGLPGAISDAFSSYVTVAAATVRVNGGSVFLGTGSVYNPALWAPGITPATPGLGIVGVAPGAPFVPPIYPSGAVYIAGIPT